MFMIKSNVVFGIIILFNREFEIENPFRLLPKAFGTMENTKNVFLLKK